MHLLLRDRGYYYGRMNGEVGGEMILYEQSGRKETAMTAHSSSSVFFESEFSPLEERRLSFSLCSLRRLVRP